jgi:hypothetical protein
MAFCPSTEDIQSVDDDYFVYIICTKIENVKNNQTKTNICTCIIVNKILLQELEMSVTQLSKRRT